MARLPKTKQDGQADNVGAKKLQRLCAMIRAEWQKITKLQSELAETNRQIAGIRQQLLALEAERENFNSQPAVIEARKLRENANEQISTLQREVSHSRRLENLLVTECRRRGIDPDWNPKSTPDNSVYSQYEKMLADEKAQKVTPGSALAFFRSHESQLRVYAKSLPKENRNDG
jgi:septal ring factor EnvC (AmiA/AmiB activator)